MKRLAMFRTLACGALVFQLLAGTSTAADSVGFARTLVPLPPSDHVAVVDVNRDGHLDLIVNHWHEHQVAVLLGDGAGSFGSPISHPSPGEGITSLPVGDLNGDGVLDLVFSSRQLPSSNGYIDIWYGFGAITGAGSEARWFYAPQLSGADAGPAGKVMNQGFAAAGGVALGDFNGDGKLDLAVVRPCCTGFSGGDNGVHTTVAVFLGGPEDATHTSEDGFTLPGRLFYRPPDFYQVVMPGSPSGGGTFITAADVNGDGVLDLVTTAGGHTASQGFFSVLAGNGNGTFASVVHHPLPAGGAAAIAIGDLDGDGKADLAFSTADGLALQLGDGQGAFSAGGVVLQELPAQGLGIVIGDFNGDGKPDLARTSARGGVGLVTVSLGNGQGDFGGPIRVPMAQDRLLGAGASGLAAGDFNGDGRLDLVVGHEAGVTVLLNTPVGVSLSVAPMAATAPEGQTQQFTAVATTADGSTNDLAPATVTWSSSEPEVATIDDGGLATGAAVGTTSITATCELLECSELPAGLVSWWRGDGTGQSSSIFGPGLIYDFHFGQHGIMRSAPTFVAGRTGQAVSLNGVNESIFVAHTAHHAAPAFTIAGWFKLTRAGFSIPASKYGGNFRGWILYANPTSEDCGFQFQISRPSTIAAACGPGPVPLHTWVHVAASYDGTTMAVHVNGVAGAPKAFPGGYAPHHDWLFIGQASWFPGDFMAGLVDEVQFYDRALSASEVHLLFAGGLGATATLTVVSADSVPPATTATVSPLPVNGWNTTDVTVDLSATDNDGGTGVRSIVFSLSGAQTGAGSFDGDVGSIPISAEGITTVSYHAEDHRGNVEAPKTLTVGIDTTPPTVTFDVPSPEPNVAGWNNTDVSISFTASDALSGVATTSVTSPLSFTAEGSALSGSVTVTDVAGNTATFVSPAVKIDETPPTLTGLPDAGCTLWPPNHRLVQVATVTAADLLSGLVPASLGVTATSNEPDDSTGSGDTAPDILISGGTVQLRAERSGGGGGRVYTITASATDLAGNHGTAAATCDVPHELRR